MKRCAIIPILWLLFSAPALADLSLRYDAIRGQRSQPVSQLRLAHGMLRIDPAAGKTSLLLDLQRGELIQIRHDLRQYFRIPLATLLQYSSLYENHRSVFQGLIDQGLRQLDPAQREQAEYFLDQLRHPRRARVRVQPLDRQGRILGIPCRAARVLQPGAAARELCIGRFQDLKLGDSDQIQLERIATLADRLRQTGLSQWFEGVATAWRALRGLPLEIRETDRQGRLQRHWRLGRLSHQAVPASAMRIPAGYRPSSTPLI